MAESVNVEIDKELIGGREIGELLKPEQLESIYLNIPAWIEKITLFEDINFVFLIDDLDRCLPENTLKMLESIKLFLDVPSCAFVLAVDDDVVERGVIHHYRDYLSIYHNKDTISVQSVMQEQLPITGHEYLEKMIQLPIRLPVVDTANAKEFLRIHSQKWIDIVDSMSKVDIERQEDTIQESEKLLDFFAKVVPSKPRKLIRVAKLFETKLKLLDDLRESVDMMFVAKLTLLELFAPELLRFIQNNGYGLIFNALCRFREAAYQFITYDESQRELRGEPSFPPREKYFNSLLDINTILEYINETPGIENSYTTKEKKIFTKAIKIIEKLENNRIAFDLDDIFDEPYDNDKLKLIVEMCDIKEQVVVSKVMQSFTSEFLTRLFRADDVDAWREALKDNDAMINKEQLDELINKAKIERDNTFNNLPFIANPEWVGELAKYLDEENYIILLKEAHDARFKSVNSQFEIDCFQMTFAEYDRYCDFANIEKPKDEGWGRGRRPVINVSWEDAQEYIEWLTFKKIGNYRLPEEKEWELACNNGKVLIDGKILWHFGNERKELKKYAWYKDNSGGKTHPVGELKSNLLKLYDMHGNIWECCEYISVKNKRNVFKGGSWNHYGALTGVNSRVIGSQDSRAGNIGFRLLRTLPS